MSGNDEHWQRVYAEALKLMTDEQLDELRRRLDELDAGNGAEAGDRAGEGSVPC